MSTDNGRSGVFIDPSDLWLPNPPPEWDTIPLEILERLAPKAMRVVRDPRTNMPTPIFSTGLLTPEQKAEMDRLAEGRWFLLRNNGPVESRLVCGRCKRRHEFFTLACIERPFHGLEELVLLQQQTTDREETFDMIRLGTIEPITRVRALRLADAIRAKGEQLYGPPVARIRSRLVGTGRQRRG